MTAETENRLVTVDLATGAITHRITLPADPQYVAAPPQGLALVSSTTAGVVTLLSGSPLRIADTFRGFSTPRITEIVGDYAYVTDDARGTLTAINLAIRRVTDTVTVGAGAHHFAFSPDRQRIWIALGESARTIVILTNCLTTCTPTPYVNPGHPRVIDHFDPGFPAHDLAFSPDGRRVWITSATGPDVMVFRARDHQLLFRVPVGPPPQHIAFNSADAYLTSGYGQTIERVDPASGKIVGHARTPDGSFELDAADGYVVTVSLLDGRLTIYTPKLRRLRTIKLAPATRDIAITAG